MLREPNYRLISTDAGEQSKLLTPVSQGTNYESLGRFALATRDRKVVANSGLIARTSNIGIEQIPEQPSSESHSRTCFSVTQLPVNT